MAIKTVSQLDPFKNGEIKGSTTSGGGHGQLGIGKNLAFFAEGYLTDKDQQLARAIGGSESSYSSGALSIESPTPTIAISDGETYWSSLFEVSQPSIKSGRDNTENAKEYSSYSIQYEDVLKNILWDVKSFLNYRNNLNDYNLSTIVDGNQTFKGTKKIPNISVNNLTVDTYAEINSAKLNNLSATNANLTNTIGENATLTNLLAHNSIAYNLSVQHELSINCNISASTRELIFDGWAYGLIDRYDYGAGLAKSIKTTVGTIDGTFGNNLSTGKPLSGAELRTGDPVCFVEGRPYELTCVNCATNSYNVVDPDGKGWSLGYGKVHTGNSYPDGGGCAVYFRDGKPLETNVIDQACHAFWSDLGEKYLGDCDLEPGTLVQFGGDKEITVAKDEVNAIVSTRAFDLNHDLEGGTVIALCGRVPTKVIGKVKKFDDIVLSKIPGVGRSKKWYDFFRKSIGKALEDNDNENIKLVECVTRFVF